MSSIKLLPNYSFEDYLRWKGRWELIDGIAYDMSTSFFPEHQEVASKVGASLGTSVNKCDCMNCQT